MKLKKNYLASLSIILLELSCFSLGLEKAFNFEWKELFFYCISLKKFEKLHSSLERHSSDFSCQKRQLITFCSPSFSPTNNTFRPAGNFCKMAKWKRESSFNAMLTLLSDISDVSCQILNTYIHNYIPLMCLCLKYYQTIPVKGL